MAKKETPFEANQRACNEAAVLMTKCAFELRKTLDASELTPELRCGALELALTMDRAILADMAFFEGVEDDQPKSPLTKEEMDFLRGDDGHEDTTKR